MWAQILTMSLWNVKVNMSDLIGSMQINTNIKREQVSSAISLVITNRSIKRSGKNVDKLNEYSWAGRSGKHEEQWFPLCACYPVNR